MKRGRKRKNVSTEEEEVHTQSSSLLPARRRSEVSQQILPVIVPVIKKEDDHQIKKTKTSIQLNTDAVDTETNIGESFKLQNARYEPDFPVACAADLTSENPNYVEQKGGNLDQFEIKREPRSRSSSTETVLNEESLQLPQDECHRCSSAETLLNEESLQLPLVECQSDTFVQIDSIYHVPNVDHIFARTNSDLSPRKESHPSFIAPVHSPNISVSQHENSELQVLTANIPSVIKLFKYNTFNKEIAIADARESLNFLNSSYPSNGSFNLFFSNDTYLEQKEISAVEPAKSIAITNVTTDELKKIIEIIQKPILTENNNENDNIIKDTNVNAPSVTVSTSQLPISIKQEKESDHIFNPNIRIKDEPIDDYDSTLVISPSVNHRVLTCNKRSAEETSTKMQGLLKKTKISSELPLSATCIESQIKPVDSTGNSIDTSKGSIQNQCLENAPITSNTLKCFTPPNSSSSNTVSDNTLQNNATMSHVFSVSRTEKSKVTDSIVPNSTSSMLTSYLHLLPNDIKDNSCTDKAADSNQRAIVSVKSSTSVGSNFAVATTASDAVVTKNYNQNPTSIDRFSTCSARQHVEETNLKKERNPSENNILVARNKINMLNFSQPDIIPSVSVTTKKKISPEMYFQRKSSSHFLDSCTQKNISQNSMPQVSSPHSTIELTMASLTKQQNPNPTPTAYTQNNADQYQMPTSAPRFEIASNVQQNSLQNSLPSQSIMSMATPTETAQRSVTSSRKQTQEDSNVSHKSSRRSEEVSSSTSRDPRKTYSKSYQKVFVSSNQYLSSLRRDIAYKKFIETKDLPYIILNWDVNWLSKQKEAKMCPPIWENYLKVKDTYQCLQHYYDTYQPLLLLNIWFDIYQGWEKSKVTYNGTLNQMKKEDKFLKMSCTFITSAADRSNRLMKEDIVICTSISAGNAQMFGRIVDMVEKDWENSSKPYQFVKPGVYKQLILEIMCAEKFAVQIPSKVQLQNVTNIGVALKQNDALRCMNPAMQAIILNPSQNEQLLQTITVPPITNVSCMLHSIRTFDKRVTIINTSSPSDSVTATLQVAAFLIKTNSILLVAVKDKESFLHLAKMMKDLNIVLAIRENEVPRELRARTVNNCDFATLMSCQVILALPSMFFGKIESRLKTESIICIIHESQLFLETETASLLAYKIEHLILTGRPDGRASTPPMLARLAFDVSLFHRILKKS